MSHPNPIDAILRKGAPANDKVEDDTHDELAALDHYRPYLKRARPLLAFAVIEADGTEHGFMYPVLRHPKFQVRNSEEFLSFTADGIAVVCQGRGLRKLFHFMLAHTLAEIREYDGKREVDGTVHISRLEVRDTQEKLEMPAPRLVK